MRGYPTQTFILFTMLLFSSSQVSKGKTRFHRPESYCYYVAVNGIDTNPGTFLKPFGTISFALQHLTAGGTIYLRGGTYHQRIVFGRSGSSGQYLTLRPYRNEKVIVSGNGLTASGNDALLRLSGVHWIQVISLQFQDFTTDRIHTSVNGLIVDSGSTHIMILNNSIHNVANLCPNNYDRSAHAIWILGNTTQAVCSVVVSKNRVFNCKTGYSENITVNGFVNGFYITHNEVDDGENIGIDAAGGYWANPNPALNFARNGIICHNIIHDLDDSHGAPGIYVDGAQHILVAKNKVYNCFRGIGIVSETTGYPSRECVVRANQVYRNECSGIYIGGYEGQAGGGGTRRCQIVGNLIAFNNRKTGLFKEIEGEIRIKMNCDSNLIAGNKIFGQPGHSLFINKVGLGGSNNQIDRNTYVASDTSGSWVWEGKRYRRFRDWQSETSFDQHSTVNISRNHRQLLF